jgi:Sec-independent protein secretion pathway component TatC
MKIIDKLLMIAMGLLICFTISWETPLVLMGLMPIIYSIIYLVKEGVEQDL